MLIVALSDKVPMAIKISYIYHKKRGVLLSQDFEGGQPWKLVRIQNSMVFPMANLTAPQKYKLQTQSPSSLTRNHPEKDSQISTGTKKEENNEKNT